MKNFLTERRIIIGFGTFTVVLLFMVLFTALASFKKMEQLAIDEFNQSQLVLARHVSFSIKTIFNTLKQELTILNLSPTIQYLEKVSLANRMHITLSAIQDRGVLEIRRIDGNRVYILNRDGIFKEIRCSGEDLKLFNQCAQRPENKGKICISSISQRPFGASKRLIMHLAIPTYQDSFDEAHPRPTHKFAGCLAFTIDVNKIAEIVASNVRSGKTGYAWVIDNSGMFIYHPRKDYVGQNAFFVRKKEAHIPISFTRINIIQRENMLRGQEGTSWYISNWHRGVTKKMKKLIAYSPVWLGKEGKPPLWSVAVVAPMQEVKTMISGVYKQQLLLQGLVLLAIVSVSFSVIGFERHYSIQLKKEVEKRTKELRASEEKYRMLVENANDLIYLIDTEGKVVSINRYGLNFITGDSSVCPEDLIGKNIFSYIRPLDNALTPETIKKFKGAVSLEHEVQIGQQKYWFNTSLIPIKQQSGEIAILGISRNITQHKEITKQLFNTEKLASLGILSAGVAHEINNPIAVILGFADLLLEDGKLSAEERQQALKNIHQEAEKCKKIVENLLMFTRYKEYTEEITDVNSNLERVIALVSNNLLIKKIKLEKELSPNLPKIKADAKQIQQVFLNIINNAIQAMPNAGCLKITTRLNSELNMVEIFIKDTGPGIKLQHRRKIFDPFFTTKPEGKGTGLGLFVSYGIITKYGGTIDFETRTEEEDKENHGTTFIIRLPIYISKQGGENVRENPHCR